MTKVRSLVVIAVVVVLGAAIVVASGRIPWGGSDDCDIPVSVAGDVSSATAAPGGNGIRVVEQGFTQTEVDGSVSLGAVVENASGSAAYRTRVTFQLFDAARGLLPGQSGLTVEIPVILPGQRIGVGAGTYARSVASFEVTMGTTTWLARDALGKSFAPITASYLRTERFNPKIPTNVDIHYNEVSTNCRSLVNRQAATIFRDAAGAIVGGSLDLPGGLIVFRDEKGLDLGGERQLPSSASCDQGQRETWVVPNPPAPGRGADARTEIYPYCDLAPASPGQTRN